MRQRGVDRPLKVLVVYGTRPEAIKMAPVITALNRRWPAFEVIVCSTGQHREMIEQVETVLGLRPDRNLGLMRPNQTLNALAAAAIQAMDGVLAEVVPDWLLVQGDTTTALAASLAAFHRGIRVGHVEAGLRTGDVSAPFPEEANRCAIDLVADALFAPTERARRALLQEGRDPDRVHLVGNTVIDALRSLNLPTANGQLRRKVLVTVHRRESFGAPLESIFGAVRRLADAFPQTEWLLPVHRNPNVREPALRLLSGLANFKVCEPLPYHELVEQIATSYLVLTDSGGIQEEAPAFAKPVLVLRETTERPEAVEAGVAKLIGRDEDTIFEETSRLLEDPEAYAAMARAINPYGDGAAAERIAAILAEEPWTPFEAPAI